MTTQEPHRRHNLFNKEFWNRSRIIGGLVISIFTAIPVIGGTIYLSAKWADATIMTPYLRCKIEPMQEPMKQDMKTVINDMKFIRGCIEKSTPKEIQDEVKCEITRDSINEHKYITNNF